AEGWAVGAYGMIYHTTNAGTDWQLAADRLDNPDRYHLYGLAQDGAGNLFLSGEAGLLYHSHDGGATWVRNADVYIGSLFGLTVRDGSVYTFGLRGNIFRSDDAGVSWSAITNPTQFSLYGGNTLKDGRILLVGAGGGVLELGEADELSTSIQSSRATLSGLTEDRNGRTVLVGMDGLEFEESDSE
ncbi:MAG: YCF48-related protein, partial [Halioglobus sp.]|nr:YCF48-related protein [Halioglobus sp.]